MSISFIIAQVFGVLGLVASVASMQFKKRKHIHIALLFLNLFAALNMVFLGSLTSANISFFAILEMVINNIFERKHRPVPKLIVALYVVTIILLGALSYAGLLDLIPVACALIFCATILVKNEQTIRKLMLANQSLWLVFDLTVGAYALAVSNILTIISTAIALHRYKKQNKKHSKKRKATRRQ